jgi:hypothetical protein
MIINDFNRLEALNSNLDAQKKLIGRNLHCSDLLYSNVFNFTTGFYRFFCICLKKLLKGDD